MQCPNCPTDEFANHAHKYKNMLGDTTTTWWIYEKAFHTPREVEAHLKYTYGLNFKETIDFLRKIPTKNFFWNVMTLEFDAKGMS